MNTKNLRKGFVKKLGAKNFVRKVVQSFLVLTRHLFLSQKYYLVVFENVFKAVFPHESNGFELHRHLIQEKIPVDTRKDCRS